MLPFYREQHQKKFDRGGPTWVEEIRQQALKRFEELGLPNKKQEAWKYTDVKPILQTPFHLGSEYKPKNLKTDHLQCVRFGERKKIQLTFVNGGFSKDLSYTEGLPKGVQINSLKEVLRKNSEKVQPYLGKQLSYEDAPFAALNSAFLKDGAFIFLEKGVILENPIELLFISLPNGHPTISHPRNLILAQAGSQASIVETYAGKRSDSPYLTNTVTEIFAEEGSVIDHYKVQDECEQSFHMSSVAIRQNRDSFFSSQNIAIGSQLARTEIKLLLGAEGASCDLSGLYMLHGSQHVDNQTKIDHAMPYCTSKELYKGILGGKSHGVFNGQILVRPGAQKTNSSLTNKNLLLSKEAIINTKPLLEILADDVKCSHGATTGRLDENQLFYLRSRGMDKELATHLLTYAFASEVLQSTKIPSLKSHLEEILLNRLNIAELSVGGKGAA